MTDPSHQPLATGDGHPICDWDKVIGPVYTTASLATALHTTPGRVVADADELRLLRVYTADGTAVYPAFQIVNGAVTPGIHAVLRVLQTGVDDPWTWAQWLSAKAASPKEAGDTPQRHIDRLRAGDLEEVLLAATRTAASWAA